MKKNIKHRMKGYNLISWRPGGGGWITHPGLHYGDLSKDHLINWLGLEKLSSSQHYDIRKTEDGWRVDSELTKITWKFIEV